MNAVVTGNVMFMRFQVPQFVDVEDKLFGPLTLRQAIYLAGGGGAAFASFSFLGVFIGSLIGIPILLLAVALAFVKINQRPFSLTLYSALFYIVRTKLYLWRRMSDIPTRIAQAKKAELSKRGVDPEQQLTKSRLKELAWSLDTKESLQNESQ